jgi:penicillin-binding protein 1A
MGITTKLDGYPAETLGGLTLGVSPLEMAVAYSTIANGGYRVRPTAIRKVTFSDGTAERPKAFKPKRTKVFEDWVTWEVTKILQQNVLGGTGTRAQIGCAAAGKTGTTDNHSDAWFVGFTPKLSTAVWVGYPQAQIYMTTEYYGGSVAGGTFPAEIWGDYMDTARGDFCGSFEPPTTAPQFVAFSGHYATVGPPGGAYYDSGETQSYTAPEATPAPVVPAPTTAPDAGGGTGQDGSGQGFDPNLYESPAQPAPNTGGEQGGTVAPGGA